MIEIYTDGACSGNGKAESFGGYAVIIVEDGVILHEGGDGGYGTTNNAMELMGVLVGIQYAKVSLDEGVHEGPINIYSDSAYVVNTVNLWMDGWKNNGWIKKSDKKVPENLGIIQQLHELMEFEDRINLIKVKGHSGNKFNEVADKIAVLHREKAKVEYTLLKNKGSV